MLDVRLLASCTMNEDLDDDVFEVTPLLEALILRIEAAFEAVTYPGDENLIASPEHRATCEECSDLYEHLRGLRWTDAAASEAWDGWVSHGMSFFLPRAWQYYLPAFLIRTIRMGYLTYIRFLPPAGPNVTDWHDRRAACLTHEQCAVVVEYLDAGLQLFGTRPFLIQKYGTARDHWKAIRAGKVDANTQPN